MHDYRSPRTVHALAAPVVFLEGDRQAHTATFVALNPAKSPKGQSGPGTEPTTQVPCAAKLPPDAVLSVGIDVSWTSTDPLPTDVLQIGMVSVARTILAFYLHRKAHRTEAAAY